MINTLGLKSGCNKLEIGSIHSRPYPCEWHNHPHNTLPWLTCLSSTVFNTTKDSDFLSSPEGSSFCESEFCISLSSYSCTERCRERAVSFEPRNTPARERDSAVSARPERSTNGSSRRVRSTAVFLARARCVAVTRPAPCVTQKVATPSAGSSHQPLRTPVGLSGAFR